MASDAPEVEWQFDAVDLRAVVRWLEAGGGLDGAAGVRATAAGTVSQVDVYLDTDDRRFQRAGYALRVRRVGRRRGGEAALKSLGGASADSEGLRRRREVSEALERPDPATIAAAGGPVGERVRAVAGKKRLLPLFEVRTRRRLFSLEAEGAATAAEVALDETAIHPADGGPPARLRRVEIELPEAAVAVFAPLVDELRAACGLQPAVLSKFDAGALSAGLEPPRAEGFGSTEVGPDAAIGAVALAVLRRHFAALRAREPGTRLGDDIEELHDMRVASRRLRAALSLFADTLPDSILGMADDLRWIGGALGAVRDLDVQLEQLGGWLTEVPPEDRRALDVLRRLLERERDDARASLLEALDSRRYDSFVSRFGRALRAREPRRGAAYSRPALAVAPDLIEQRLRAVRRSGRAITPASPPAAYHRLRIRGKRLRYALEFLADLYPGGTRPLVRRLVALQDLLGLHQDAATAIERLRGLVTDSGAALPPETIFAMGEVAGRYKQSMTELERRFPAAYARVIGPRWRRLRTLIDEQRPEPPAPEALPGEAAAGGPEPAPAPSPAVDERAAPRWPGLVDGADA